MSIILEIDEADPDQLGTLGLVIDEACDDVWVVLPRAEGSADEQVSVTAMTTALDLEAKLKAKGFKLTLREEGSTEDLLKKWREQVARQ